MMKLEVAYHMCLKHIQSLPHLTRSDMVTGLLGFTCIETFIDFFGTLCSLEPRELSNKLLHLRLYQFKHSVTATAYGFIPDINRVLTKYELISFRDDYLNSGLFPPKYLWKRISRQRVLSLEEQCWSERLSICSDFTRFSEIHSILTPSNL